MKTCQCVEGDYLWVVRLWENLNFFFISLCMSSPLFHKTCFQMTFSVEKSYSFSKDRFYVLIILLKCTAALKEIVKKEFQHNIELAVPWNKWIRWLIWRKSIHFVIWFLAYHRISHGALIVMSIDEREY